MGFFEFLQRGGTLCACNAEGEEEEQAMTFFEFLTREGEHGSLYHTIDPLFCPGRLGRDGRQSVIFRMNPYVINLVETYLRALVRQIHDDELCCSPYGDVAGTGIMQIEPDISPERKHVCRKRENTAFIYGSNHAFFVYDETGLRFWTVTPDRQTAEALEKLYHRWLPVEGEGDMRPQWSAERWRSEFLDCMGYGPVNIFDAWEA